MIYGSVCSGIEAASVAWHPLGWRAAFLSEIENFPRAVLQHHYPDVPLHGDFTTITKDDYEPIDLLVGGTPCQDFSVAGLRAGITGDRGNLTLEFVRLADRLKPRWLVWENVPGVLSSDGGRALGSFLGALEELGYGWAYRTLDAQYFGVAQRRRRVFVVGYLGDWRRAAAVLFERASLSGHPAPSREKGKDVAPSTSTGTGVSGYRMTAFGEYADDNTASTMKLRDYKDATDLVAHSLRGEGFDAGDIAPTLRSMGHDGSHANGGGQVAVAFDSRMRGAEPAVGRPERPPQTMVERTGALDATKPWNVAAAMQVRRLTPTECERLQGFPDGYTDIQPKGKPTADGPRYKALGNSMAVPVMHWIGRRIQFIDMLS